MRVRCSLRARLVSLSASRFCAAVSARNSASIYHHSGRVRRLLLIVTTMTCRPSINSIAIIKADGDKEIARAEEKGESGERTADPRAHEHGEAVARV